MLIAQLGFNALSLGAAYGLVALGFVLTLIAAGAVNFAHGDLVVAGGYLTIVAARLFPLPLPAVVLLPVVVLGMALIGIALASVAYLPLRRRPASTLFVSTIAVGILLQGTFNDWFGAEPLAGPALLSGENRHIGAMSISIQSLAMIVTAGFFYLAVGWLMTRSQIGRELRAAAQDPVMARALGIPVDRLIMAAFALAAALAGAAGLLLANPYFVTPTEGSSLMLKGYIAAALGGWGRLGGALVAALFIAGFEVGIAALVSAPVAEMLLYAGVLGVLSLRPGGLFGEPIGRRS